MKNRDKGGCPSQPFERPLDTVVAVYPQGRRVLAEVAEQAVLTHGQFIHVEVVLMGMGHNQIGDRPEVQAEFERESVNIGVGNRSGWCR